MVESLRTRNIILGTFFVFLFSTFAYLGWIGADEEILFLIAFLNIVWLSLRLAVQSAYAELDFACDQIAKRYGQAATTKSLSLHALNVSGQRVQKVAPNVRSISGHVCLVTRIAHRMQELEARNAAVFLKHKALKIISSEGFQFFRAFVAKQLVLHWKQLREELAAEAALKERSVLLPGSDSSYSKVFALSNSIFVISGITDSTVITTGDVAALVLLYKTL